MHPKLACEITLYLDGLVSLTSLSNVAHELLAEDDELLQETVEVVHLIAQYDVGIISEPDIKHFLPKPVMPEPVRDTEITNMRPESPLWLDPDDYEEIPDQPILSDKES